MKKTKKRTVIALTSDPYQNIYGYAFVFMRLFDHIQRNNSHLNVVLLSNNGTCSLIVKNENFKQINLNQKSNIFVKTFFLTIRFVSRVILYDKQSVVVANAEIPELLAASILKLKFKNTYCLIHDLRLRDTSLLLRIIYRLRLFLIRRIGNVIFTNRYTMNNVSVSGKKAYIGNPIF